MISRRRFMQLGTRAGIASTVLPLLFDEMAQKAFGQIGGSDYRAVVVIALNGGNDSNNTVVPIGTTAYAQYIKLRTQVALSRSSLIPLAGKGDPGLGALGLHPSLVNIAQRYNQKQAAIVANVGPLVAKVSKTALLANQSLMPESLLSHPGSAAQWLSASTVAVPETGWGGRIADVLATQSGKLPPVLSASGSSVFSVGNSVQGIAMQSQGANGDAIPVGLQQASQYLANIDATSQNHLVAAAAKLRQSSLFQQAILSDAMNVGSDVSGNFSTSNFGSCLKSIAQIINGRSVTGASRQSFFCSQGNYDLHASLLSGHPLMLNDLDTNVGAFMNALDVMGMMNKVLVCTHSDFNRTMQCNSTAGTDHGWGSHQILLGGAIQGGQVYGNFPSFDLGGSDDLNSQGVWIPTTSVTQMVAGVGSWMGLNNSQLAQVFPTLSNFSDGAIRFS